MSRTLRDLDSLQPATPSELPKTAETNTPSVQKRRLPIATATALVGIASAATFTYQQLRGQPQRAPASLMDDGSARIASENRQALQAFYAGQLDSASQALQKLTAQSPKSAPLWANLGTVLRHRKDFAQAETAYAKALELDAHEVTALNGLGTLRLADRRFPEARTYFTRALEMLPENAVTLLNLGKLAESEQKWTEATDWYQRSLRGSGIDPALRSLIEKRLKKLGDKSS